MIIGLIILVVLGLYVMSAYNGLVKERNKVKTNWSQIDVVLKRRNDLIPNLVETVKGYAKHEKETLFEVVSLRQGMTIEEKNKANHIMDENMHKAEFLIEEYPDLKASANFLDLQATIVDVEEHLQAARRLYNSNVSLYNQQLVSFPTSAIAKSKGMVKKEFFEADEVKKNDVKIEL